MKKNIQFSEGFELGFLGFVRAPILGTATAPETNRSYVVKNGGVLEVDQPTGSAY